MSGVGTATALALALREADPDFNFGMLYVRKENENSHGERVEYNIDSWDDEMKRRFIFVDDFVSTGASYAHAMYMAYNELDVSFKNFNAAKTSIVQMNHSPFNCETNFNTLNSMVKKLVAKGARK